MPFKEEKVKEINQFLKKGSLAAKHKAKAEIVDGKIQYSMLTRLDRDPYRTRVDFMKVMSLLDGKDMRYLVKKYGKTPVGGTSPARGNKAKPKAVSDKPAAHEFVFNIELKAEDDIEKSEKTIKAATKADAAKKVEKTIGNHVARYKLVGKDGEKVTGEKWCEIDIALPGAKPARKKAKVEGDKPKPGKVKMTYDLAMAAGKDAANERMRKAGRTSWNRGDYELATATFSKLWPEDRDVEAAREAFRKQIPKAEPGEKPATKPGASKEVKSSAVFWDVDTQVDFMLPAGKLYVPGAVDLIPMLKKITKFIQKKKLPHYSSLDVHAKGDKEFLTFPEHCVAGTKGVKKIPETVVDEVEDKKHTIKKAEHSPFSEKETMAKIVADFKASGVKTIIVYGVATDYCVVAAALGFAKRGFKVVVIKDAIAGVEPKTTAKAIADMKEAGVRFKTFDKIVEMLSPGSKPTTKPADKPAGKKREKKEPASTLESEMQELKEKMEPVEYYDPEKEELKETIAKAEKIIEKASDKPKTERITFKQFRSRLGTADQEAINAKIVKLSTANKESLTGPGDKPVKASRNAWITKLKEMGVALEAKPVKTSSTKRIPTAAEPKPVAGDKKPAEKKLTFMEYVKVVETEKGISEGAITEETITEMSEAEKKEMGLGTRRTRSAWDKHMINVATEATDAMEMLKKQANASVEASGKEYVRDPTQTVPKPGDNIIDYMQEIHRGPFTKKEKSYLDVDGYVVETTFGPNYKKPRKHQPGKEPAAPARPRQPKAEGDKTPVKAEPKISPALAKERDAMIGYLQSLLDATKGTKLYGDRVNDFNEKIRNLKSYKTDDEVAKSLEWARGRTLKGFYDEVEGDIEYWNGEATRRGLNLGAAGEVPASEIYIDRRYAEELKKWLKSVKPTLSIDDVGQVKQMPRMDDVNFVVQKEIENMPPEQPSTYFYTTKNQIHSDEKIVAEKGITQNRLAKAIWFGGLNIKERDVKIHVNGDLIKTNYPIPGGALRFYGIEKSTKQAWDAAEKPKAEPVVVKKKLEEGVGSGAFEF